VRKLDDIVDVIDTIGFNCVRLPYSLDAVFGEVRVPNPEETLHANPDLQNLSPLEIMDRVIKALSKKRIMTIINNHIGKAMWCCNNDDGEGLWYTDKYPEGKFFDHVKMLSGRYNSDPYVMGFDLRNELRNIETENMSKTVLWYEKDKPDVSWAPAAEKAGNFVVQNNENMLVFVEGIHFSQDIGEAKIAAYPVHEKVGYNRTTGEGKVVYSSHMYSWFPVGEDTDWEKFVEKADKHFGYLQKNNTAPLWIGEFGTDDPKDNTYWKFMLSYLSQGGFHWAYWAIDGQKNAGENESFGLLNMDYQSYRYPEKIEQLNGIMSWDSGRTGAIVV